MFWWYNLCRLLSISSVLFIVYSSFCTNNTRSPYRVRRSFIVFYVNILQKCHTYGICSVWLTPVTCHLSSCHFVHCHPVPLSHEFSLLGAIPATRAQNCILWNFSGEKDTIFRSLVSKQKKSARKIQFSLWRVFYK